MLERLQDDDWGEAFAYAPQDVSRESVVRIVGISDGYGDGDDWIGLFELADGRFMLLCAWCDYTGWDCQAGGDHAFFDTEKSAVQSLTDEQRNRLDLKMVY